MKLDSFFRLEPWACDFFQGIWENADLGSGLGEKGVIFMYMMVEWVWDACLVFKEMPVSDRDLFNSLACDFGSNGSYDGSW